MSSPVRYSYLSTLFDNKADIFPASLLISYYSFSSLTWSSTVMILLYFHLKTFFVNLKGLSDGKVVSSTKKEYCSPAIFYRSLWNL